jgi:class 3 adenylate cyclase
VRRTVPTRNLNTQGADRMLRISQALAILYGIFSLIWPDLRAHDFMGALMHPQTLYKPGFYLFAIPLEAALLLSGLSAVLLILFRRPDVSERRRLVAFLIAAPFMASGLILPIDVAPVATAIGLLILLIGAVQYHVVQGQRAQFMSRFLSPQVAEMVRESGLKSAVEDKLLEISVVCCDLRGFTAFTKAVSSRRVIEILREYYNAVGEVAAAFGGTIKDQAGDGVLILVGAPLPFTDHAQRAVEMARRIRNRGLEVVARHSNNELELGVGVGVSSGLVTVGVIGDASRLEYTAVGPPVNLASRLCDQARSGEILIDERTAELIGDEGAADLTPGEPLQLKGYQQLVPNYVLLVAQIA